MEVRKGEGRLELGERGEIWLLWIRYGGYR
jgi:hypothetical protein